MLKTTSKAPRRNRVGLAKLASTVKQFILDTNVLLHDPEALFNFQDNFVFIPVEALEELDKFKTEQSERGANARRVHRHLNELFGQDPAKMQEGVTLPSGGKLLVAIKSLDPASAEYVRLTKVFPDIEKMDNRILATALHLQSTMPLPTIVVSKDINMRLKALALGLRAEDYLTDKKYVVDDDAGPRTIPVSEEAFQHFYANGSVNIEMVGDAANLGSNEYCILEKDSNPDHRIPVRHYGNGEMQRLKFPNVIQIFGGTPIKPRSFEQQFAMDALSDPTIPLVTLTGKAGTGKTILAVATALAQVINSNNYDGVTISRPIIAMGKDLGALPGTLSEKLSPWLQPYFDSLSVLMPARSQNQNNQQYRQEHPQQFQNLHRESRKGRNRFQDQQSQQPQHQAQGPSKKPYERLIASGALEIEALQYIRGRSIPRRIFILDEAQNLTPHEVKTIISRMSEGSKIILMGDPAQIDNPFVDARSNGLVYTATKFKTHVLAAHVRLTKGERSPLAEAAADLL